MTRYLSNLLKSVKKDLNISINKASPNFEKLTSKVKVRPKFIGSKQIPVVDPNSWVDINKYKIDIN